MKCEVCEKPMKKTDKMACELSDKTWVCCDTCWDIATMYYVWRLKQKIKKLEEKCKALTEKGK